MDYKEKYEQALERARQFSEKPYLEDSAGIVEYIFPELKESEDERIRKQLLKHLREAASGKSLELSTTDYERWATWLEKQDKNEEINEMSYRIGIKRVLDNPESYGLEKQSEQKPAWSEEDERMYSGLHNLIYSTPYCDSRKELSDWFKSLKSRVQPKQEWNEEDDVKINRIVSCLENLNVADNDILLKDINWLKSLRHQNRWKPSDEQMVALKHAFNDGSIDFADMKILGTLYEQLKALHRYEQDT